jgi:RNA polymerase sigma-70 factor, ECF subfamily
VAITAADTNWPRIVTLYAALVVVSPTPVTQLNRLVALSMAQGAEAAYAELGQLEDSLAEYSYFHATRANFLARLQQRESALAAYRRALELATNPMHRAALSRSAAKLEAAGGGPG